MEGGNEGDGELGEGEEGAEDVTYELEEEACVHTMGWAFVWHGSLSGSHPSSG